jgi:hypothetical protein
MTELETSLTALLMAELYEDEESGVEVLRDAIMAMLNDGEYLERDGSWDTFNASRIPPVGGLHGRGAGQGAGAVREPGGEDHHR